MEGKVEKGRVEHGKELCFKSQTNVVYLELVERVTIFNNPRGGGKKDNKMFNNGHASRHLTRVEMSIEL